MIRYKTRCLALGLWVATWVAAAPWQGWAEDGPVRAELLADSAQIAPGDTVRVGVLLQIEDGWHIYGEDPGLSGLPTEVSWDLPEGVEAGDLRYPEPEIFEFEGEREFGYSGEVLLQATLRLPDDLSETLTIGATASWLACEDLCIPGSATLDIALPVGDETVAVEAHRDLFGEREAPASAPEGPAEAVGDRERVTIGTFAMYLLFGFIGGIILNIMPCVLPVIGLKFMGLVKHAGDSPRQIIAHAWVFTAGIVASLWVLAIFVVALQATGRLLGQGFQLANFPFLVIMSSVIFVLGLSMLGVFLLDLGTGVYKKADEVSRKSGFGGSFGNGILVALLATPCTAPVLGVAMGFAFTQPPWVTFVMFTAVGLGLAFPFIVLGHFPGWVRFIPKPGVWMEYLKQGMGFLMMAAVVWLLWLIHEVRGGEAAVWTVAFLLVLAFAAWLFGTFRNRLSSRARRILHGAIVGIVVFGVLGILETRLDWRGPGEARAAVAGGADWDDWSGGIPWEPFSPERLNELLEETDRPVFVNFTAAWCITCKANERAVIDTSAGRAVLEETGTIPVYADWTDMGGEIGEMLREFDRAGIPFYLVYGRDRDNPETLSEVLTPGAFERSLRSAAVSFEDEA